MQILNSSALVNIIKSYPSTVLHAKMVLFQTLVVHSPQFHDKSCKTPLLSLKIFLGCL